MKNPLKKIKTGFSKLGRKVFGSKKERPVVQDSPHEAERPASVSRPVLSARSPSPARPATPARPASAGRPASAASSAKAGSEMAEGDKAGGSTAAGDGIKDTPVAEDDVKSVRIGNISNTLKQHEKLNEEILTEKAANNQGGRQKVLTGERKNIKDTPPPKPIGDLQLIRLKFDTLYDVCADRVEDFNDYKNFYILKDGDYYHWLWERKDPRDLPKPRFLPVTIHSHQELSFTATFRVEEGKVLPAAPNISVIAPGLNFESKPGQTSGEFKVRFKIIGIPYKDIVGHIGQFELDFRYSTDGGSTMESAGISQNELFITWKKPLVEKFKDEETLIFGTELGAQMVTDEVCSMKIECHERGGGMLYIPESILYLGCVYANAKGNQNSTAEENEIDIIESMFSAFESCHTRRRYEGFPVGMDMGYWRGSASLDGGLDFTGPRYLLRYGVGRCGEWAGFFLHLTLAQGILQLDYFTIATEINHIVYFPVKRDEIGRFISVEQEDNDQIDYYDVKSEMIMMGDGADFESVVATPAREGLSIIEYSAYKTCMFLIKNWRIMDPEAPYPLDTLAQGNTAPLSVFKDHVFLCYRTSEGKLLYYDPSYGKKSAIAHENQRAMLKSYCDTLFTGVLQACRDKQLDVANPIENKLRDQNHTSYYTDLFTSLSYPAEQVNDVSPYLYHTVVENMQDYLITG